MAHARALFRGFATLTSMCVVLAICSGTTSAQTCPRGMISYWNLDETTGPPFVDFVNGNNGTCSDACPTWALGIVDGAHDFDGSTTGIDIADDDSLDFDNADSFSVEAWIKTTQSAGLRVPIGRPAGGSSMTWWLGLDPDNVSFFVQDSEGTSAQVTGTAEINDGDWHHVVVLRDAATHEIRIYVDGAFDNSASVTYLGHFAGNKPLQFGYHADGYYYAGLLDEIALYNRALPAIEIETHYNTQRYLAHGYCCTEPVEIMPLGDSITVGSSSGVPDEEPEKFISYRKELWDSLTAAGYDVDFVGSQVNGEFYDPPFDPAHEGYDGQSAAYIASHVYDFLVNNPADVALLHIGTNDINGHDVADIAADVELILDNVDQYEADNSTSVAVVLARIINQRCCADSSPCDNCQKTTDFNAAVADMALKRSDPTYPGYTGGLFGERDRIIIVDMENIPGFDYHGYPVGDMWDNLHPHETGYTKMATAWLDTLDDFLPLCNHNPELANGDVAPDSGDTSTTFTYSVDYYDQDGDNPSAAEVYVDGSPHTMSFVAGSGFQYHGTYQYQTTLPAGPHNYYFSFSDAYGGSDTTETYSGPSVTGQGLAVTPSEGLTSSGTEGGPFTPSTKDYTLENLEGDPIEWTASNFETWVTLSDTEGTLAPGASTTVTVSINSNADSLPPGSYSDTVTFTNTTSGLGNDTRQVTLDVASQGALAVTPPDDLNASGFEGGPFTPSTKDYTLENTGGSPISWTAANGEAWTTLSDTNGTLAPGANTTMTVSINSNADSLPSPGPYSDTITFTNTTNGLGNDSRQVTLTFTGSYVDGSVASSGDGTTWDQAFKTIQEAIDAATAGDEIRVRMGTYSLSSRIDVDKAVEIVGGFDIAGQRDWANNITTVDGQGSVYHCFYVTADANIDGFDVTGGNANGRWPHDGGGGICNTGASPTITNCTFSYNNAFSHGGAIFNNSGASPTITNCTFFQNSAEHGGAIRNSNSGTTVTNCTFSDNSAGWSGGAISNYYSSPAISNCIFWDNVAPSYTEIFNSLSSNPTVTFCDIDQDGYAGRDGNIRQNPEFVPAIGDYHLQGSSPCIDMGDNDAAEIPTTDFDGEQRIMDGDDDGTATVDMGADEYKDTDGDGLPDAVENTTCTDANDADTDNDGISDGWEDSNQNGVVDEDETDPCDIDTDGDGIQDGTELGYTLENVGPHTDTDFFQPDLDPTTVTDPLDEDSDGDHLLDGQEDANQNGRVDEGETDPNLNLHLGKGHLGALWLLLL